MALLPEQQLKLAALAAEQSASSSAQVMESVAKWLADPSTALPDRLQACGVLSPENRARLESLVEIPFSEGERTLIPRWRTGPEPFAPAVPEKTSDNVTPECVGRYARGEEHARGGQAKIFVAVDRHLGREIAWKELRSDVRWTADVVSSSASPLERFLREARITGQLEHPNIVPVYELGRRPDGTYYYTMRLVRGRSLSAALEGKALAERLLLLGHFRDVCHALAFAHSRGIIHRDVKPANVMVGEFGETVLLDWGIAKIRGSDDPRGHELERRMVQLQGEVSSETLAGDALGTPSYMSPEQAEGRIADVDERSDVWGLGALLYEILVGHPPYLGDTALAVLAKVSRDLLTPVRSLCPEAPAELAAIAEKALQKDRGERYQTAREMAEDVTAFTSGLRVGAYAYSSWQLLRRFAARNKALIAAVSAIFVAVVVALVVVGLAWRRESVAREREQQARAGEAVERRNARYHLAQADAREAARLADENNALAARVYAAASLLQNPAHPSSLDPDPLFGARVPDSEWLRVDALSLLFQTRGQRVDRLVAALRYDEAIYSVAFSPDGRYLAVGDYAGDLTVRAVDEGFAVHMKVRAHRTKLMTLAFSPDSNVLATGGGDGVLAFWDLKNRTPLRTFPPAAMALSAARIDPSGTLLARGDGQGHVILSDLLGGHARELAPAHTDFVRGLVFTRDGKTMVSASWDKIARVWDVTSGKLRATLAGHTDGIYGVVLSADGERVITASYDRTVRVWELSSGRLLSTLDVGSELFAIALSADGARFAVAGQDGALRLYDEKTLAREATVRAHVVPGVAGLAFHPGGRLLASVGMDHALRIWSLGGSGTTRLLHPDWAYGLAWTPDGRYIVSGCWDRVVRVWDAHTHALVRSMGGHEAGINHVTVSPDGKRIAASVFDGNVRLWDLASGRALATLRGGRGVVHSSAFSPDGNLLAAATDVRAVVVFDTRTGGQVDVFEEQKGMVYGVAFSPDGSLLAMAGEDRLVRLYDLKRRALVKTLEGHRDWVSGLSFSQDGSRLASAGKDGLVIVWSVAEGKILHTLAGHAGWANDVAFSRDGKLLASAGVDARVVVWDAEAGRPLLRLRTAREAERVAFSPDGAELAFTDFNTVTLWHLQLPWNERDPAGLLRDTQDAAGLALDGFEMSVAVPPGP